jgi:hypothetical protein
MNCRDPSISGPSESTSRVSPALGLLYQVAADQLTNFGGTPMTTILPRRSSRELNIHTVTIPQAQILPAGANPFFPSAVQAENAQSDHEAWTAVCTILITIVSLGLLLGIGAVLLTL